MKNKKPAEKIFLLIVFKPFLRMPAITIIRKLCRKKSCFTPLTIPDKPSLDDSDGQSMVVRILKILTVEKILNLNAQYEKCNLSPIIICNGVTFQLRIGWRYF